MRRCKFLILVLVLDSSIQISETLVPKSASIMNDEVFHLDKLFGHLEINEVNNQALRIAHDSEYLGIEERRALESETFRENPSHLHEQLWKIFELLVHISRCKTPRCKYPNCGKAKGLFRHSVVCKRRAPGGCPACKKVWNILQLHALACNESKCAVPRCRDLKEHHAKLGGSSTFLSIPEPRAHELLVHSSECRTSCQYPLCRMVKGHFRHSSLCKIRATGGCCTCKEVWVLIYRHSRVCKESNCNVPRCRDMKENRLQSIHDDEVP